MSFTAIITIPRGLSSVSYTISLVDDDVPESTESFDVRICQISGYYVSSYSYTAVVTIIDDDSKLLSLFLSFQMSQFNSRHRLY